MVGGRRVEGSKSKYWCVVPGCNSDSRKKNKPEKYPWMQNVSFEPFPTKRKNPKLRAKWVAMIRRPLSYKPLYHHRVCSRHFTDNCKSDSHPVPELFPWNDYKRDSNSRNNESITKRMKTSSTATPTCTGDDSASDTEILPIGTTHHHEESFQANTIVVNDDGDDRVLPVPVVNFVTITTSENQTFSEPLDAGTDHSYSRASYSTEEVNKTSSFAQTDLTFDDIQSMLVENENLKGKLNDKDTLFRDIFIEKVTKNDESVRRFTGLPNKDIFNFVKDTVVNLPSKIKYWTGSESQGNKRYQDHGEKPGPARKLPRSDELILTLIRFRLALPVFVIAQLFGVSCSRVSSIFTTWMFCLYYIFKDCITWPSRELVRKFMPRSFQRNFPRTRAIIDCTEIFIERPRNPSVNARTYSTYKSHNTVKFLVSITPTGAFNFISQIWGGNTSDRHITMHSGFLDLVSAGDEIMADRGFIIKDLLTERKAYLTIPPFTRKCHWGKGKYLSATEIRRTRQIANLRIHVERAIQRMKTFKLISQTIPWNIKSLIYPMVVVAAFFCNLKKPLVKKN